MNFKKNWKRFWTLSSAREGFTLVELIVVIAILAILAGVAVPAYSGYVKKANMQADMTLASEVAHALTLYYYAHPEEVTSGYVVLGLEESSASDEAMIAAMDAAFGDGWEQTILLKHNGWQSNSATVAALYSVEKAEVIKNSAFMDISTETLLNDVQTVVTAASTFLTGQNAEEKLTLVQTAVGGEDKLNTLCEELGINASTATDDELSNLLVFAVASGAMASNGVESNMTVVEQAATNYASYIAYAYANPDDEIIQNAFITMSNSLNTAKDTDAITAAFDAFKNTCGDGWTEYEGSSANTSNREAFTNIMQAVNFLQPSLASGNLADSDYFLNSNVGNQLDTYLAAIGTVENIASEDLFAAISNGGVAVFLYPGPIVDCSSVEVFNP